MSFYDRLRALTAKPPRAAVRIEPPVTRPAAQEADGGRCVPADDLPPPLGTGPTPGEMAARRSAYNRARSDVQAALGREFIAADVGAEAFLWAQRVVAETRHAPHCGFWMGLDSARCDCKRAEG